MNKFAAKENKKVALRGYENSYKPMSKETYTIRQDNQTKYKTELCRNLESGFCEFGEKCFFAHCLEELRGKNAVVCAKIAKCKEFFELGYCINGSRCQYNHRDNSPETAENSPNASKKASRKGSEDTHKLPIFIDLESRSPF